MQRFTTLTNTDYKSAQRHNDHPAALVQAGYHQSVFQYALSTPLNLMQKVKIGLLQPILINYFLFI